MSFHARAHGHARARTCFFSHVAPSAEFLSGRMTICDDFSVLVGFHHRPLALARCPASADGIADAGGSSAPDASLTRSDGIIALLWCLDAARRFRAHTRRLPTYTRGANLESFAPSSHLEQRPPSRVAPVIKARKRDMDLRIQPDGRYIVALGGVVYDNCTTDADVRVHCPRLAAPRCASLHARTL